MNALNPSLLLWSLLLVLPACEPRSVDSREARVGTGEPRDGGSGLGQSADHRTSTEVRLYPGRKRDEIPPVDEPEFGPADADALRGTDRVIGVYYQGEARAYPLWILETREIVNDRFKGDPLCVTYCTLSASAVVFLARVDDRRLTFGNDGALYECNLVLYDRQSNSLWYQLGAKGVRGRYAKATLTTVPAVLARWSEWRTRFPDSAVLIGDRQNGRYYRTLNEPKPDSDEELLPAAPVSRWDTRLPAMEHVVGFQSGGRTLCLPKQTLAALAEGTSFLGGADPPVLFRRTEGILDVVAPDGSPITAVESFWFTWHAAYPGSDLLTNPVFRAVPGDFR